MPVGKYWSNSIYYNNSKWPYRMFSSCGQIISRDAAVTSYVEKQLVEGEFAVTNPIRNHFFVIHFLLPLITMILTIVRLIFLHNRGLNNPLAIHSNSNHVSFHTQFNVYTKAVSIFCGTCFATLPVLSAIVTALVTDGNFGKYFVKAGSMVSAGMLTGSW